MNSLRLPAEQKFDAELQALAAQDSGVKPPGWKLSPRAVETYVMGSDKPVGGVSITPKYIGDRALVQVAIATLASDRALMLVGEPGTAKSWLSEHLSAAISGTSALIVQGTAGTSEEHVKYSWNYALLLAEGPSSRSRSASRAWLNNSVMAPASPRSPRKRCRPATCRPLRTKTWPVSRGRPSAFPG